jgi:hypothetical protein
MKRLNNAHGSFLVLLLILVLFWGRFRTRNTFRGLVSR